jgi:hypothetical protein
MIASVWMKRSSVAVALLAMASLGVAEEDQPLPLASPGTRFFFDVIDSQDAKYLWDSPSHVGKNGGLTVRPQVALGDAVYRIVGTAPTRVGTITLVQWDRVRGSLSLEFKPLSQVRIAVGDEVWIDLNPVSPKAGADATE